MYGKVLLLILSFFVFGVEKSLTTPQNQQQQQQQQQVPDSVFGGSSPLQSGVKFFQDTYMAQVSPSEIEFGHVCENPKDWEQRFERINFADKQHQGKVYNFVPSEEHYQHGHKKGANHHFIEKHEKVNPHVGEFQTKVRWGDKHGGYGEHYWDFNHGGDGDGDGDGDDDNVDFANYHHHHDHHDQEDETKINENIKIRRKRGNLDVVEFIDDRARFAILKGQTGSRHGGNYKAENDFEREKREGRKKLKNYVAFKPINRHTDNLFAYELPPIDY